MTSYVKGFGFSLPKITIFYSGINTLLCMVKHRDAIVDVSARLDNQN